MRRWKTERSDTLFDSPLFRLDRQHLEFEGDRRQALVLDAPCWVNVIPILPDGRVILVRQWRFGIAEPTLEIPGGMVDPGEDEAAAAARELLEETGHSAKEWRRIGEVHPNPAFINNRCGTWVATGLERVGEPLGDGEEEIELETAPLAEIPGLIARGDITHALVIAAFYYFDLGRG
jgi:8-oxo-dGTP pyrophosphatase MutT (NUDIX family)